MSKHLQKAAYLPTIDVVETIYPKEIRDAYSAYHKTGEWLKEQG